MAERSPLQDGRRAWTRLTGWHPGSTSGGVPSSGAAAVNALADIGLVRRLLDHVELLAVRSARAHGQSWAEIATHLGVSRQSAWEKWRDLDDEPAPAEPDDAAGQAITAAAQELRRHALVRVPNVVGLTVHDARARLRAADLVAVGSDPDQILGDSDAAVTDQSPESGAKVPPLSAVTLWLGRGDGGSGVREPRRPKPTPRVGRALMYNRGEEPGD